MIILSDQIFTSLGLPIDTRESNLSIEGNTITVETLEQYLERVDVDSRYLGLEVNFISPFGTYDLNFFIQYLKLNSFTVAKYRFEDGVLNTNLIESSSGNGGGGHKIRFNDVSLPQRPNLVIENLSATDNLETNSTVLKLEKDNTLNKTSTNVIQNNVVATKFESVDEDIDQLETSILTLNNSLNLEITNRENGDLYVNGRVNALEEQIDEIINPSINTKLNVDLSNIGSTSTLNQNDVLIVGQNNNTNKTTLQNVADYTKTTLTPEEIVSKLETLEGDYRLDGSAIKNLPSSGGSSGFGNNLYFSHQPSDIPNYYTLTYNVDANGEIETFTVSEADGEKTIHTYIFPNQVGTNTYSSGLWNFTFYGSILPITGNLNLGITYFRRLQNGTEIDLFTSWSNDINVLEDTWFNWQIINPQFEILSTDRMGVRMRARTDQVTPVTVSYVIGDGYGAYITTPNKLRHSQLREFNQDPNYQHVTETEKQSFINKQDSLNVKSTTGDITKYLNERGQWVKPTPAIADVTNLQTILNSKSNTGHTHSISDVSGLSINLNNLSSNISTLQSGKADKNGSATEDFNVRNLIIHGESSNWMDNYFSYDAVNDVIRVNKTFVSNKDIIAYQSNSSGLPSIFDNLPIGSKTSRGILQVGNGIDVSNGTISISPTALNPTLSFTNNVLSVNGSTVNLSGLTTATNPSLTFSSNVLKINNSTIDLSSLSTDLSNYYNKSSVDVLLGTKANTSHTHAQSDINNTSGWITTALSGKQPAGSYLTTTGTAADSSKLGGIVAGNYYHSGNANRSDVNWYCRDSFIAGYLKTQIPYVTGDNIPTVKFLSHNDSPWGLVFSIFNNGNYALQPKREVGNEYFNLLFCHEGGNVGIGTTSPTQRLHVSGNILAAGEVTAYSDRRLKSNITPLEGALDKVLLINPVRYIKDDKPSIGVIAQELQELYPELVTDGEYLSVNYAQLTAVIIKAIQELKNKIDGTTKQ